MNYKLMLILIAGFIILYYILSHVFKGNLSENARKQIIGEEDFNIFQEKTETVSENNESLNRTVGSEKEISKPKSNTGIFKGNVKVKNKQNS